MTYNVLFYDAFLLSGKNVFANFQMGEMTISILPL